MTWPATYWGSRFSWKNIVQVKVKRHARFERSGDDLHLVGSPTKLNKAQNRLEVPGCWIKTAVSTRICFSQAVEVSLSDALLQEAIRQGGWSLEPLAIFCDASGIVHGWTDSKWLHGMTGHFRQLGIDACNHGLGVVDKTPDTFPGSGLVLDTVLYLINLPLIGFCSDTSFAELQFDARNTIGLLTACWRDKS